MLASSQATQSEVLPSLQQLGQGSQQMTSLRLLTGAQTLFLGGFTTARCMMPLLVIQFYPPGDLIHKDSSVALSKAQLHLR